MPPSTWPVSPTLMRATRTSPRMMPSTCNSPSPERLPSRVMSLAMSEATRGPFLAPRSAGAAGAGAGAGPGAGVGPPGPGEVEARVEGGLAGERVGADAEAAGLVGLAVDGRAVQRQAAFYDRQVTHLGDVRCRPLNARGERRIDIEHHGQSPRIAGRDQRA